jgi:4a-hydroxytetrahydrobiopterin dehydratase
MRTKLNDEQLASVLRSLPGWAREGDAIVKTFTFKRFADGIGFVQRMAAEADRMDHHPDIDIRYTKIRVALSTHDRGGVTGMDTDLAARIDGVSYAGTA